MMKLTDKIFIAGHRGLVGSAIVKCLEQKGYVNLLTANRGDLDLFNQEKVNAFFENEKPDYVFLAAAKVGGIYANNTYRGEFIYENLMIQCNVIEAAKNASVKRLLFLGSSCIYPKLCPQPIKEEYLLTSPLEPTNEPYAIAKIAGLKLCQAYNQQYGTDFISVMPTNLYGPGDHYDLKNSHVLPALLRKVHEAKLANADSVAVWGTGQPKREFLYIDDLAAACVFLMNQLTVPEIVNIGSGMEVSIAELAEIICRVVGFAGKVHFDASMPDGTPRKRLDTSVLDALGWRASTQLEDGIVEAYKFFDSKLIC